MIIKPPIRVLARGHLLVGALVLMASAAAAYIATGYISQFSAGEASQPGAGTRIATTHVEKRTPRPDFKNGVFFYKRSCGGVSYLIQSQDQALAMAPVHGWYEKLALRQMAALLPADMYFGNTSVYIVVERSGKINHCHLERESHICDIFTPRCASDDERDSVIKAAFAMKLPELPSWYPGDMTHFVLELSEMR